MKIREWIAELRVIVYSWRSNVMQTQGKIDRMHAEIENLKLQQKALRDLMRANTALGIDISPSARDASWVITVGRYKGRDYVQTFVMRDREFTELVTICKDMERHALLQRVDAPPEFRYVIER